ncbi:hypothetical protein GCM10009618_12150 [Nesterenkonia lacusekhoensis]
MTTQMGMDLRLRGVVGAMAAGVLIGGLAGCGDDTEADAAEQTGAAEGAGTAEGAEAPSGENSDGADGGAGQAEEADEPEPVPASSDGPAENWPEPEVPEEASERTEEGVEAALQHWFETRQYARNTGDTAPLEAASTENCAFCLDQVEQVESAFEQGWYVQDLDEVTQTTISFDGEYGAQVAFLITQASYEAYMDGELLGESEAQEEMGWSAALTHTDNRWVVADLVFVGGNTENEEADG